MTQLVEETPFLIELRETVAEVLDVEETLLGYDTHFVDDLGVDSLMALELMVTLERNYNIKLTETALRQMVCLRSVHDLLTEMLGSTRLSAT